MPHGQELLRAKKMVTRPVKHKIYYTTFDIGDWIVDIGKLSNIDYPVPNILTNKKGASVNCV